MKCSKCNTLGGRHGATCPGFSREGLTTVYDRVTEAEIEVLWTAQYARLRRYAARIVGDLLAEDCVSDVVLWFLEKRRYLPKAPDGNYFIAAVHHKALTYRTTAWARRMVAMDAVRLEGVEKTLMDDSTVGLRRVPV
jgi:DNA-directed RNA polymerase specialized sigma24 family protein